MAQKHWREENPHATPDLIGADHSVAKLPGAGLTNEPLVKTPGKWTSSVHRLRSGGPLRSIEERRAPPDRRARPTPMLSRYLRRGRRLGARRSEEAVNIYVDRYRFAAWAPIVALLAMATVDWLWTLRHLSRGLEEANPILAWTLATGGTTEFSITKLGISVLGCGFLLLHARFRYTRILLPIPLAAYAGVMTLHMLMEIS